MSITPGEFIAPASPSRSWLTALASASNDLRRLVDGLSEDDLRWPSFAGDWSIAQVLSHLGSGAEICAELVRRGLAGSDQGPKREELVPVWDRWNAMSPAEQREQWSRADLAHIDLLQAITAEQEQALLVPYFAGPMDLATYLGYRLSEHALHGWDIAVALDPGATVGQLDLIWERIDLIATRFHDATARRELAPQRIVFDHDGRRDRLDISDEIHLILDATDAVDDRSLTGGTDPTATITVTTATEVLTRLFYGRLRDSDRLDLAGRVTRSDLVRLFPGF